MSRPSLRSLAVAFAEFAPPLTPGMRADLAALLAPVRRPSPRARVGVAA